MMNQGRTANPLDRNNDGKVDLKDLAAKRPSDVGLAGTSANPIQPGFNQQQGILPGQGVMNQGRTANPLDRNNDGRVDLKDLTGQQGYNQQGLGQQQGMMGQRTANPLDRNNDGRVDLKDLTGQQSGFNNNDRNRNGIPDNLEGGAFNDRNRNGIPDSQERMGQQGMRHNPLDRNYDGRVDSQDFMGSQTSTSGFTRETPIAREQIQKEVVIHEHIHPIEKEEIQQIIYREREQLDVRQITQQLHETQIQPTFVQQRELAPEYREAVVQRSAPIQENVVLPSVDRDATMRSQVVHAPIVNETIKRTVIEEIQPVLERDIIQSTLIQETKNIYEKVIEAPTVFRETRVIQERGTSGGSLEALSAQGFNLGSYQSGFGNDRNMNGIPDNLERNSRFNNDQNRNGIPDNLEGGAFNDRNRNGIPDSQERMGQQGLMGQQRTANPLDRNNDGRVDLKDLTGQPGYNQQQGFAGQQGLMGQQGLGQQQGLMGQQRTANPLDRNNDGRVDLKDLTGQPGYNQQQGFAGQQQGLGQQGLMGQQRTANPLDRNNDGRVDLKDLTGQQQGLGQQGLMGQQRTANPLDRNNDGKVDLRDLSANKAAPVLGSQAPLRTL